MGLNEIKTIKELLEFLPLIVKAHKEVGQTWTNGMSIQEFVSDITSKFEISSDYYGIKEGDKLYYFIAVERVSKTKAVFWSFYMSKEKSVYTRRLLETLKAEYARRGFKKAEFSTNRITRSYHRWVTGFGAIRSHITYTLNLQ